MKVYPDEVYPDEVYPVYPFARLSVYPVYPVYPLVKVNIYSVYPVYPFARVNIYPVYHLCLSDLLSLSGSFMQLTHFHLHLFG